MFGRSVHARAVSGCGVFPATIFYLALSGGLKLMDRRRLTCAPGGEYENGLRGN